MHEIFKTMTEGIVSKRLEGAIEELQKQTPPPMNTMFDKQSREEAIAKKKARDSMTMVDVPQKMWLLVQKIKKINISE